MDGGHHPNGPVHIRPNPTQVESLGYSSRAAMRRWYEWADLWPKMVPKHMGRIFWSGRANVCFIRRAGQLDSASPGSRHCRYGRNQSREPLGRIHDHTQHGSRINERHLDRRQSRGGDLDFLGIGALIDEHVVDHLLTEDWLTILYNRHGPCEKKIERRAQCI